MNDIDVAPKPIQQYGALCFRNTPNGPKVLLITTRETRRWMIPKGWPIPGLKPRKVAEREAWEEAGVIARAKKKPFGEFFYDKLMQDGSGRDHSLPSSYWRSAVTESAFQKWRNETPCG
ncbi:NUDIX hydrolase (plasmid) [Rhizobium leguminosarum]